MKRKILRKFKQDHRNTFSQGNDYSWIFSPSVQVKKTENDGG